MNVNEKIKNVNEKLEQELLMSLSASVQIVCMCMCVCAGGGRRRHAYAGAMQGRLAMLHVQIPGIIIAV